MTKNKSSRVLVNLIGIPLLLSIIYTGDSFNNLPIFSVFIAIVLFLGAREISALTIGKNGNIFIPMLLLFLAILQIDRHPVISWDISVHLLIVGITLATMILEVFRREAKPLLNISILIFAFVWLGLMLGSLSTLRNLPEIGFRVTFALFLSVWICDTSAFFFGKKFGE
jgi:CDP-diglyceride synthetase